MYQKKRIGRPKGSKNKKRRSNRKNTYASTVKVKQLLHITEDIDDVYELEEGVYVSNDSTQRYNKVVRSLMNSKPNTHITVGVKDIQKHGITLNGFKQGAQRMLEMNHYTSSKKFKSQIIKDESGKELGVRFYHIP